MAVLVVDVDDFEHVDDTHGHLAGDQVLVEIGPRGRERWLATDLLAHWDGDGSVVLLPHIPVALDQLLAERVRESVSASARLRA